MNWSLKTSQITSSKIIHFKISFSKKSQNEMEGGQGREVISQKRLPVESLRGSVSRFICETGTVQMSEISITLC